MSTIRLLFLIIALLIVGDAPYWDEWRAFISRLFPPAGAATR
jgi:hypothetical protein